MFLFYRIQISLQFVQSFVSYFMARWPAKPFVCRSLFSHHFEHVLFNSLLSFLLFVCFLATNSSFICALLLNYLSARSRHSVPTLHLDVEAFDCSSSPSDLAEDNKKKATREEKKPRMFHLVARRNVTNELAFNATSLRIL